MKTWADEGSSCRDYDGKQVSDGDWFKPEKDPCVHCKCDGGRRGECVKPKCAAPKCDKWEPVEGVCCGYRCLSDTGGQSQSPAYVPPDSSARCLFFNSSLSVLRLAGQRWWTQWRSKSLRGPGSTVTWGPSIFLPPLPLPFPSLPQPNSSPLARSGPQIQLRGLGSAQ